MPIFKIEKQIEMPVVCIVEAKDEATALAFVNALDEAELVQEHLKEHDWYMTSRVDIEELKPEESDEFSVDYFAYYFAEDEMEDE